MRHTFTSTTLALFASLTTAACGVEQAPAPSGGGPGLQSAPVVYGTDDRVDWYSITDADLKAFSRGASAAMIDWGSVQVAANGTVQLNTQFTLGQAENLCQGQLFRSQPITASCSGTLIADDLILTAAHCAGTFADCTSSAWVFDYLYESDGVLADVSADDVYRCVDVVVNGPSDLPGFIDIAVVQLDRPVVGRTPAHLATNVPLTTNEPLLMLGYPSGLPLKVDDGGQVAQARTGSGDYFVASVDSFAGNSGSGVFNAAHEVVGVLTNGATDYVRSGNCNVVNVLAMADAEEEVMYAHWATAAVCAKNYPSAALCGEVTPICGDGWCTGTDTLESCPADCTGPAPPPAGWICNPSYYDAGDDCDCDCGVRDPDCDKPNQAVLNCAPGGVCQADGSCDVSFPSAWTCRERNYAAGDGCDCDCGAYDPDCDDPSQRIKNCAPGSVCQADGTCETSIPAGWQCRRSWYGAGDDCDCDCGAYDPDCDNAALAIQNCNPGQVCGSDGQCTEPGPGPEPVEEPGPEPVAEVGPEPVAEPVVETIEAEPVAEVTPDVVGADSGGADVGVDVNGVAGKASSGCAGSGHSVPADLVAAGLLAGLFIVRRRRVTTAAR